MYGKNPNHANKFRRIFNKKYPPGNCCAVYYAISAGCIGCRAGFLCPCRGPDEKRSGDVPQRSGSIAKAVRGMLGDRPGALRNIRDPLRAGAFGAFGEGAFGMFGDFLGGVVRDVWRFSGRGVRDVWRFSGRGRLGRSETLLSGRSGCSEAFLAGSFETFGGSPGGDVRGRIVRSARSLTVRTRTGLLRAAVT